MTTQRLKKRKPGTVLLHTFPVAKYLGLLLISLNIGQLPQRTWLLPGIYGSRQFFLLWTILFICLSLLADRHAQTEQNRDQEKGQSLNLLSFLALAVPGLLLLDALSIVHLYLSWYFAGAVLLSPPPAGTVCMAIGCVLWIYGQAMSRISFGCIWGIRTAKSLASETNWRLTHLMGRRIFCFFSFLFFFTGFLFLSFL